MPAPAGFAGNGGTLTGGGRKGQLGAVCCVSVAISLPIHCHNFCLFSVLLIAFFRPPLAAASAAVAALGAVSFQLSRTNVR